MGKIELEIKNYSNHEFPNGQSKIITLQLKEQNDAERI
jgi:hypothetical protein